MFCFPFCTKSLINNQLIIENNFYFISRNIGYKEFLTAQCTPYPCSTYPAHGAR